MHTQTLSMHMNYGDQVAECVVDFSSSNQHEQGLVKTNPAQYLNTIMPILTSALAGICHQYKEQPGFAPTEIINYLSVLLEEAVAHRVVHTRVENIVNPQMN